MIAKRFAGYRDKTGHPIDEGSKVKIVLGGKYEEAKEWIGTVQEFNRVWYVVFRPGQHTILASVAEYCEVI